MVGVSQTEVTFCVTPTTDDDEDYTRQAKQAMPANSTYIGEERWLVVWSSRNNNNNNITNKNKSFCTTTTTSSSSSSSSSSTIPRHVVVFIVHYVVIKELGWVVYKLLYGVAR